MIKLSPKQSTGAPIEFQLREGRNTIGRGPGNDVTVEDPGVSLCHCEVTVLGDSAVVKDLGSTNGTWINQARVTQRVLRAGETLKVGGVELVLEVCGPARESPALPEPTSGSGPLAGVPGPASPAVAAATAREPAESAGAFGLLNWLRAKRTNLALVALVPLAAGLWHAAASGLRSARLRRVADELASVKFFLGDPEPNHTGSRVVFSQMTEDGIGLFLHDMASGRTELVHDNPESLHSAARLRFLGWSPDDRYFAYGRRVARREIVICDGNSGKSVGTIRVGESPIEGVWLKPQRLVYSDEERLFEVRQANGKWGRPQPFRCRASPATNRPPIARLTAFTPGTVLWQEGSNLWSAWVESEVPTKVWSSGTNELLGFFYSSKDGKLLLLCRDEHGQVLNSLKPQAGWDKEEMTELCRLGSNQLPVGPLLCLNSAGGYAYAARDGVGRDVLVVRAGAKSEAVVKPWGLIHTYAATESQVFVIGSFVEDTSVVGRYEPTGIWRYDARSAALDCVVSNVASGFRYARLSMPQYLAATNAAGKTVAYSLIRPTRFSNGKRYPVVVGFDWMAGQQAAANAGVFFASVPGSREDWDENVSTVYEALVKNPSINTNLVYVLGASAGAASAGRLIQEEGRRWRGAILFSPLWFPEPSLLHGQRVLIDCGGADARAGEKGRDRLLQFQEASLRAGIPVRVAIHPDVGHNYRSSAMERARVRELVRFLQVP